MEKVAQPQTTATMPLFGRKTKLHGGEADAKPGQAKKDEVFVATDEVYASAAEELLRLKKLVTAMEASGVSQSFFDDLEFDDDGSSECVWW